MVVNSTNFLSNQTLVNQTFSLNNATLEKVSLASQYAFEGITDFAAWATDLCNWAVGSGIACAVLCHMGSRYVQNKPSHAALKGGLAGFALGAAAKLCFLNPIQQTLSYTSGAASEWGGLKLAASYLPPAFLFYLLANEATKAKL